MQEEGPDVVQEAVEAVMPSAGSNLSEADKLSGSWWTAKVGVVLSLAARCICIALFRPISAPPACAVLRQLSYELSRPSCACT